MATLSGSVGGGVVTLTGTGYTPGATIGLSVAFTATDGRRRYVETYQTVIDGSGNLSFSIPIKHASGSMTISALTFGTGTILVSSSAQAV